MACCQQTNHLYLETRKIENMRITQDAIDDLDDRKLKKAVENAESDGRKTIRAEDMP
jgi:histone H3/H4